MRAPDQLARDHLGRSMSWSTHEQKLEEGTGLRKLHAGTSTDPGKPDANWARLAWH